MLRARPLTMNNKDQQDPSLPPRYQQNVSSSRESVNTVILDQDGTKETYGEPR